MSDMPYVFVVDDDPSVRSGLWRLLVSDGLRVATFASAREFLDDPRIGQPGCIVIDLRMPDSNGLQLQAELKRRRLQQPVEPVSTPSRCPALSLQAADRASGTARSAHVALSRGS